MLIKNINSQFGGQCFWGWQSVSGDQIGGQEDVMTVEDEIASTRGSDLLRIRTILISDVLFAVFVIECIRARESLACNFNR